MQRVGISVRPSVHLSHAGVDSKLMTVGYAVSPVAAQGCGHSYPTS